MSPLRYYKCVFIILIADVIPYQVATPSLARIRGSFCLVRLLKVFKPVSNPLGLIHFPPDTPLQDPFDLNLKVWTVTKPFASDDSDLTLFLHIVRPLRTEHRTAN